MNHEASEATQDNLTRTFYDRISHVYDLISNSNEHAAREAGLKALAVREGEKVLEIGFGTGHSLVQLAQAVGETGQVCGVDISPGMLQVSQKRVDEAGLSDRVKLQVGDSQPLPYDDAQFDAVSMSFTLELFPLDQIPGVLGEIRRVLRPGGRLGVVSMATTPEGQKESGLTHTYKWMHQHFPHIVDCQPIDAVQFLKDAGFEIKQRIDLNIWSLPVVALVGQS